MDRSFHPLYSRRHGFRGNGLLVNTLLPAHEKFNVSENVCFSKLIVACTESVG